MNAPFIEFPKIPRLSRDIVITEKIDGTNAQIYITDPKPQPNGDEESTIFVGSRTRWITPEQDNYGFARWVYEHAGELMQLGPGRHFGEWWGGGIQRGYGLPKGEKRFSLFNTSRWNDDNPPPACCGVVPVMYIGSFDETVIHESLAALRQRGSLAAPGFMRPEGVVIFHTAANVAFKKTLEKDESPKGKE